MLSIIYKKFFVEYLNDKVDLFQVVVKLKLDILSLNT